MPDRKLIAVAPENVEDPTEREQDEVDAVLAALRHLYQKVTSPVIRACLEGARSDIAYLASSGAAEAVSESELADVLEEEDFEGEGDMAVA